jgi:tetraacyldisaccharide-1-P 4'-kinase
MKNETPNYRAIKNNGRLILVGGGGVGGTAKTTISLSLADYFRARGIPVVLVDAETERKPKGRLKCYYPEAIALNVHDNSALDAAGKPAVNQRLLTLADLGAGVGDPVLE